MGEIMSLSIKLTDHALEDGTIPELWVAEKTGEIRGNGVTIVSDKFETARWLRGIDAPISVNRIEIQISGRHLTPAQTAKILEAMAGLMVAISEVGYEMAAAAYGGEG
jgi:hypothetical protein